MQKQEIPHNMKTETIRVTHAHHIRLPNGEKAQINQVN